MKRSPSNTYHSCSETPEDVRTSNHAGSSNAAVLAVPRYQSLVGALLDDLDFDLINV